MKTAEPYVLAACIAAGLPVAPWSAPSAAAALPPGNTVEQWNKIAEDTVVGSGAFQNEGLVYMAYVSAAVYDAVVAIEGSYEPYGRRIHGRHGASPDCAVVEAAYRTLQYYFSSFPSLAASLDAYYAEALSPANLNGCSADGGKGQAVGLAAANTMILLRTGDGRVTPIASTSLFPTLPPGPGVWRLTPSAYAAPQTPWVGEVRPFVLESADQFLPHPPPSLASDRWMDAFDEIKSYGVATGSLRTDAQTAIARFWTANVIRQYGRLVRDLASSLGLDFVESARLAAMVFVVGADAQISVMYAKYHYLFWRPVTALDPSSVNAAGDGFGPVPGFDDGNPATAEQAGWRPLLTTPNHPEYPAAHGSFTGAISEVLRAFLGTSHIDLDIHGFDAAGAAGNLDAVQHFATAGDLRRQIVEARLWGGLHYRFSGEAGVELGRNVATYDLQHAFRPVRRSHDDRRDEDRHDDER